ncbi:MAG: aspartate/glutamate racemase family protein [Candidatus Electrothrix sp. Rat3]|nr:aspartate/glutamate racemase family protein [Candidatus Electrothrix rattekaaiensis]
MLTEKDNYFYIDTEHYPNKKKELPIGIFDSGTGGLTVFNSIINLDEFSNTHHGYGGDHVNDFKGEKFIYLGDLANMPYGNYHKESKDTLLEEHIIKDVQFLLSNKYYPDAHSATYKTDKSPVKSIVIACNTATAYGTKKINLLMDKTGLDIKVIGVIDAGARAALEHFTNAEKGIIGLLATAGTVSSGGYEKAIRKIAKEEQLEAEIEVVAQGGTGIAEAIDGDKDYYDIDAVGLNPNYKGPVAEAEDGIRTSLLDMYHFNFSDSKILCDTNDVSDCSAMQINDPVNYMRFHLVSLLEKVKDSNTQNKLKVLILGCTHYPYLEQEIHQILDELYQYRSADGEYRYKPYMEKNITLIDPAQNTAVELYEHIKAKQLFATDNKISESELYISVPNSDNRDNIIDNTGKFPYSYKYGRAPGILQEYVKRIPMTGKTIDTITLQRIREQMPMIYQLLED